jgi:hypothetical protein
LIREGYASLFRAEQREAGFALRRNVQRGRANTSRNLTGADGNGSQLQNQKMNRDVHDPLSKSGVGGEDTDPGPARLFDSNDTASAISNVPPASRWRSCSPAGCWRHVIIWRLHTSAIDGSSKTLCSAGELQRRTVKKYNVGIIGYGWVAERAHSGHQRQFPGAGHSGLFVAQSRRG